MDLYLTGKRALVTGGSSGLGRAIARQLALEGTRVAIAARDRQRLTAAAKELGRLGLGIKVSQDGAISGFRLEHPNPAFSVM